MFKHSILTGVLLGIITGLLTTLFDGFFMLMPRLFVPGTYPLVLMIFNISFWTVQGCIAGTLVCLAIKASCSRQKEAFYWVLFFLIPFTLLYGYFGRIYLPHLTITLKIHDPIFDKHFSFLWVGILLSFLLIYYRKGCSTKTFTPIMLIPEIAAIIILFQFCSNPECLKINSLITYLSGTFLAILKPKYLCYLSGVIIVFGLYAACFRSTHIILQRLPLKRSVLLLFVLVNLTLWSVYGVNVLRTKEEVTFEAKKTTSANESVPQIILIVIDTLRLSSLTAVQNAGFAENLKNFSQESLVFKNCVAPASWTYPSHASLFTGVYPTEHGCLSMEGVEQLPEQFITLAEIFRDNGYKTAAVVSNYGWLSHDFQTLQGYEISSSVQNIGVIHKLPFRPLLVAFSYLSNIYAKAALAYRTADDINNKTISILEKISGNPFFIFVNYMDVHTPYRAPPAFENIFLNQPFPQAYRLKQYYLQSQKKLSKESWDDYILSQYMAEIAYFDTELGRLFNYLKQTGMYDSSLIIVTSDHGETFGEHGFYEHLGPLHETVVKIPLIIKFPYAKRIGNEKGIINLTDVYPTVLSICNLTGPKDISGAAFGSAKKSGIAISREFGAFYSGNYKYLESTLPIINRELYNIKADPGETKNLIKDLPDIAEHLKEQLHDWRETHILRYTPDQNEEFHLSDDVKEGLRALGYVE